MKIRLICFTIVASLFTSCFPTGTTQTIEEDIGELENSDWQLAENYGLQAFLKFGDTIDQVSGFDGCNNFSADIVKKNYQIELTNFISSEKYCEDLEDWDKDFQIALSKVVDYRLTKKNLYLDTHGILVNVGKRRTSTILFKRIEEE